MKVNYDDVFVTDFTVDGKCSNCGSCCSNLLPLSECEVRRIKEYIKNHHIKEQRHNVIQGVDMTCPFRDETAQKCLIYKIRPAICRQFMCSHRHEDIAKARFDFQKVNRVVFMRAEFFGNKEDINFFAGVMKMVAER